MSIARRTMIRLIAVGLCVALIGCGRSGPPQPVPAGGAQGSKADKARKDAESLAMSGVTGGAKAVSETSVRQEFDGKIVIAPNKGGAVKGTSPGAKVAPDLPDPKSAPRPGSLVRERVSSEIAYTNETDAKADALARARVVVEQKLAELDPPLKHKLSLAEVEREFVRKSGVRPLTAAEKETYAELGWTGNYVYGEYEVEITAEQVRELRAQERVSSGMRVIGLLIAVALVGFLFLRTDEWTKGYLTHWLALGAVALASGAAAALIFV